MTDELVIQIEGLTKCFGKVTAVDNLSMEVRRGHIYGLLGPNGSGKTVDRQRQRSGGDGCQQRGQTRDRRDGRGYQLGRRLLVSLPALTGRQGPRRGGTGGIGLSSGTQGCHRNCLRWGQLAAVPHPLHDQPAHSGPQARSAVGGHHGTHHLPAAVPSGGPRTARAGDRPATGSVPSGRLSSGRGWTRYPGLLQLPRQPLEEDLVQQPPGAPQQEHTATHRRRGHLPQPASRSSSSWGCPS